MEGNPPLKKADEMQCFVPPIKMSSAVYDLVSLVISYMTSAYPRYTIVVYDSSLWRMQLCHKGQFLLVIRSPILQLVLKTLMTELETSK